MIQRRPLRLDNQRGTTLLEMLVAAFIMMVFMLSAGTAYLVNQTSYRRNNEKLQLQQAATWVLEEMEKKTRVASTATVVGTNRLQLYDLNGIQTTYFRLSNVGPNVKLFEGSDVIATQELIALNFVLNPSGTAVLITITLQDNAKNNVTMRASAALRNNVTLRNIQQTP